MVGILVSKSLIRPCLDPNFFLDFDTVALLLLFDKYCPIIE